MAIRIAIVFAPFINAISKVEFVNCHVHICQLFRHRCCAFPYWICAILLEMAGIIKQFSMKKCKLLTISHDDIYICITYLVTLWLHCHIEIIIFLKLIILGKNCRACQNLQTFPLKIVSITNTTYNTVCSLMLIACFIKFPFWHDIMKNSIDLWLWFTDEELIGGQNNTTRSHSK